MKKFRELLMIKRKRIAPDFSLKNLGTVLLFLLLIPYPVTFMFGNLGETAGKDSVEASMETQLTEGRFQVVNETDMGRESIPLELYVTDKLARTMDADWEIEALKAQAVLIRSGLYWELEQREAMSGENEEMLLNMRDEAYGSVPIADTVYQAVAETAGFCMAYEGRIVPGAYFAVSNGATRNGWELGLEEYSYLNSVLCSRDFLSEDYNSSTSLSVEEFSRIWETLPEVNRIEFENDKGQEEFTFHRDSVGYVLDIEWQDKWVSGEIFRQAYHIPSAGFRLSKEGKKIVITAKGAGHGLGMSQFTANEMAKEGKTAQEILNYFFKDVTITKIE